MTVLLTRPRADSLAFARILEDRGVASVVAPLLTIVHRPPALPPTDGVQGLVVTSANGADALARTAVPRSLPVLAVGPASAQRAQAHGFNSTSAAGGDLESLAAMIRERLDPGAGDLLHISGSAVAGDLGRDLGAQGFAVRRVVGYHAQAACRLPRAALEALLDGRLLGVAHFSPRTAAVFTRLVEREGVTASLNPLVGFCLSEAVARSLERPCWKDLVVSPRAQAGSLAEAIACAGERS